MLFHSKEFLFLYFPIVVFLFYFLFNKQRKMLIFLIISSLIFYSYFELKYLFLIIVSISINYFFIKILLRFNDKKVLILGILFNLILLGYYKYSNFVIDNLNFILDKNFRNIEIVLPLAISFFTFQQMSFLVEVYFKNVKKVNFIRYFSFITFFPQLIAGPILNYKELFPSLRENKFIRLSYKNLTTGFIIFILGLFKKVIIADGFAVYVDQIFESAFAQDDNGSIYYLLGMFFFSFQIYFDFSAYSDMAVGIAKIFGFNLPLNFNSPYKSKSFIEFWTRWHITLSRFIKTYLYQPLLYFFLTHQDKIKFFKISNKLILIFLPLIIAFSISGFWHGAAYGFIIWGFLHGFFVSLNYLILEKNLKLSFFEKHLFLKTIIVFLAVSLMWIPFRCVSFENTIIFYKMLFINENFYLVGLNQIINFKLILLTISSVIIIFVLPNSYEFTNFTKKNKSIYTLNIQFKPNIKYFLLIISLLIISIFNLEKLSYEQFIYFQF